MFFGFRAFDDPTIISTKHGSCAPVMQDKHISFPISCPALWLHSVVPDNQIPRAIKSRLNRFESYAWRLLLVTETVRGRMLSNKRFCNLYLLTTIRLYVSCKHMPHISYHRKSGQTNYELRFCSLYLLNAERLPPKKWRTNKLHFY